MFKLIIKIIQNFLGISELNRRINQLQASLRETMLKIEYMIEENEKEELEDSEIIDSMGNLEDIGYFGINEDNNGGPNETE